MLIGGLKYPIASATLGFLWSVFRVLYAVGYTQADKENGKGRYAGVWFWFAQAGLFGLAGKMGYDLLMA